MNTACFPYRILRLYNAEQNQTFVALPNPVLVQGYNDVDQANFDFPNTLLFELHCLPL